MVSKAANWYAVKARPGTQRKAAPRVVEEPHRKGEFIIERYLRDENFEVYMPSTVREVRHHRTKEFMVKRFPMMVGYVFVKGPVNLWALNDCDGVSSILGMAGAPMPILNAHIEAIRQSEQAEVDEMERLRAKRKQREKLAKGSLTRKEISSLYPKHRRIEIKEGHSFLSGFRGYVTSATGRNTVKAMIETLNGLVPVELDIEHLAEAV